MVFPRYESKVERVAQNDFEQTLIAAAESACPMESDLAEGCSEEVDATESCDWSCGETPYFKVPYAVMSETVTYYQALVDSYRQFPFSFAGAPRRVSFEYRASVAYDDARYIVELRTIIPVYVVKLQLKFGVICGSLCGYHVDAERKVIFDTEGNLIEIDGDAQRGYSVS